MKKSSIPASLVLNPGKTRSSQELLSGSKVVAVLGALGYGSFSILAFAQQGVPASAQGSGVVEQESVIPNPQQSAPAPARTVSVSADDSLEKEGLSATVGHSVSHDSNLFRVDDGANPQSDTINSTTLSLGFNKSVSQQRFQLEVAEIINKYSNSSYLDYNATNYRGGWQWTPSRRWSVQVTADRSESLAPFEDTIGGSLRNVGITKTQAISADGWLIGNWYVILGASRVDRTSELGTTFQPDEKDTNAEFGVRYVTEAGNTVTAIRRSIKGDYVGQGVVANVTGTSFTGSETSLAAQWRLTPQSEFKGRVGRRERSNEQVSLRDFSGPFGELQYLWQPTSKLSFDFSVGRSTEALLDPSFSYTQNDELSFEPSWRITEKITTYLRLQRQERSYRGEGAVPATGPAREDTSNNTEIGVSWAPLRNVTTKASFLRQHRTSNLIGNGYDDNLVNVSASWMFW